MAKGKGRFAGTSLLVIISAPSGGGKTSVINALRRRHPDLLYSISATTRSRRAGERTGTHYYFATVEEFERMKSDGLLLESARVHGHYYGTPRANVDRALRLRRVMLFDVDVQGAASIRSSIPEAVTIFLLPPSLPALMRRLTKRASETRESRALRLETARTELLRADEYDYWVTNDDLNLCVDDCEAIIRAELLRRTRQETKRGQGSSDLITNN